MGNVVREVAFALGTYHQDEAAYLVPQARVVVQHLADKGLIAPAPLREEWADTARAEAGRRWGWPSTVKHNSEMSPSDWLDEGMASGFVVGALWAVDPAEGDGSADQ